MSKSDKDGKDGDYEVGRGKPPHQTQWKKGVSGNPSGKKKGAPNLKAALEDALLRPVTLTVNGEKKVFTMLEALVMRLAEAGLKGDTKATNSILDRIERLIGVDREQGVETSEEDHEILQRFLAGRDASGVAGSANDTTEMAEKRDTSPDEGEDDHA